MPKVTTRLVSTEYAVSEHTHAYTFRLLDEPSKAPVIDIRVLAKRDDDGVHGSFLRAHDALVETLEAWLASARELRGVVLKHPPAPPRR